MNRALNLSKNESDLKRATLSELIDLYNSTVEELQHCANVSPLDDDDTEGTDMRESALLGLEECLLKQVISIDVQSDQEMSDLIKLWRKVVDLNSGEDLSPSDRIAQNVLNYVSEIRLDKN